MQSSPSSPPPENACDFVLELGKPSSIQFQINMWHKHPVKILAVLARDQPQHLSRPDCKGFCPASLGSHSCSTVAAISDGSSLALDGRTRIIRSTPRQANRAPSGSFHTDACFSCSFRWPRFHDATLSSGSRLQWKGRASWALWCAT